MDSRLIYAGAKMRQNINWKIASEDESIHIGTGEGIKRELVLQKLEETFNDENVFISLGRRDSKELKTEEFESEVLARIGELGFIVCNKTFTKFIDFNPIGVLRIGEKRIS